MAVPAAKKLTLDDKHAEKGRLLAKARIAHRALWAELCAREPRLMDMRKAIRRTRTPAQALSLLAESWARRADPEIRDQVLRQIDRHANRMARLSGRPVLDDPLPPQTNVYFIAREMLAVR